MRAATVVVIGVIQSRVVYSVARNICRALGLHALMWKINTSDTENKDF